MNNKKLCISLVGHVDAGKTTLSEAFLYTCGTVKKQGRVDNKDSFLDTDSIERARGITVYSKQAMFSREYMGLQYNITILDTPGHADFSAETERVFNVLDAAVLVISGQSGVQAHTKTIWKLLKYYNIPTIIYINKSDMPGFDRRRILDDIKEKLTDNIADIGDFTNISNICNDIVENIASFDEEMMEEYLEKGNVSEELIIKAFGDRKLFPLLSGSALKLEGTDALLNAICAFVGNKSIGEEFGAFVYKISRDEKNRRLTHVKIFGGKLKVKDTVGEEKINEIRQYNGSRFETLKEAEAGDVVSLLGPNETRPGDVFGATPIFKTHVMEPVLSYAVRYPDDVDRSEMLEKLRLIEEEIPEILVETEETNKEIRVSLMGEIQTQILTELIERRYNIKVTFDVGHISYKETIKNTVYGGGHFEPLRHYAEVHLKLEPLDEGSGMMFCTDLSEDLLDVNWQRLIMTHLEERLHRGVLTGSPITDIKITVIGGKAHPKHTEGGDFRQATYRAVRQGLMQAESVLLEPYYDFTLEIPERLVGKALTDIERMSGRGSITENADGICVINGTAPVSTMHTYSVDVAAYTGGEGRLSLAFGGYHVCHNADEIIENTAYNPDADLKNPSFSIFCRQGSGTPVMWDKVFENLHVPINDGKTTATETYLKAVNEHLKYGTEQIMTIGTDEIDEIINKTSYSNSKEGYNPHKAISARQQKKRAEEGHRTDNSEPTYIGTPRKEKYVLVDGYNVIYAWPELKSLATDNIDAARDKLLDILCNYQGYCGRKLTVVFDAYRRNNTRPTEYDYYNIHVVYTAENQKADNYIERFANDNRGKYEITVVSSDGMIQIITRGLGCYIVSSNEFLGLINDLPHV